MTELAVEPTVTTGPIAGSQKIYRDLEVSPLGPPPRSRSAGSICPTANTSTFTTPPAPTPILTR